VPIRKSAVGALAALAALGVACSPAPPTTPLPLTGCFRSLFDPGRVTIEVFVEDGLPFWQEWTSAGCNGSVSVGPLRLYPNLPTGPERQAFCEALFPDGNPDSGEIGLRLDPPQEWMTCYV